MAAVSLHLTEPQPTAGVTQSQAAVTCHPKVLALSLWLNTGKYGELSNISKALSLSFWDSWALWLQNDRISFPESILWRDGTSCDLGTSDADLVEWHLWRRDHGLCYNFLGSYNPGSGKRKTWKRGKEKIEVWIWALIWSSPEIHVSKLGIKLLEKMKIHWLMIMNCLFLEKSLSLVHVISHI